MTTKGNHAARPAAAAAALREWMSREQREHASFLAQEHDPGMRARVAERIAWRLIENTNTYRRRNFFVIDGRKPVPFSTQWRRKNKSGVTFKPEEVVEAQAWVLQALLAGFTVFYSSTKGTWGSGRALKDGLYSEDAEWLCQQLRIRGIEY
jgi:hypothetical protein